MLPQPPRCRAPRLLAVLLACAPAAAAAQVAPPAPLPAQPEPPAPVLPPPVQPEPPAPPLPDDLPPIEQPPPAPPALPVLPTLPRPPPPPHVSSVMNMLRGDVSGSYYRGTSMVGYGTRKPYQGGAGTFHVEALWFHGGWIGFDVNAVAVISTGAAATPTFALEGALAFAPFRWKSGSFVLGGGHGFTFGDAEKVWMPSTARLYPVVFSRLRLLPTRRVGLHAGYRFIPVETTPLSVRVHDAELAIGVDHVLFGARLVFSEATGGDPTRTYRESSYGLFFGGAYY